MKYNIQKWVTFMVFVAMVWSCKKDETQAILKDGTAPALVVDKANIVLDEKSAAAEAAVFSWSASDFGFQAAVTYKLQLGKKGNDFKKVAEVNLGPSLKKAYKTSDFNQAILNLGLTPGASSELEARVQAVLSSSVKPVLSNVISFSATPYLQYLDYTSLWVPGNYQGWDPATAPKISSQNEADVYEGYMYMKEAINEFKLTPKPVWGKDYGSDKADPKKLVDKDSDNLKATGAGFYRVSADLNTLTWAVKATEWGIIGEATPDGWNSDQNMTLDKATGLWKITLALKAGKFKFRANDAWDINFGDDGADAILDAGGADIVLATAGTYEVTLKLATAGNYTYILTKK
jgi:starch-binding outer membrane protein SusE/F